MIFQRIGYMLFLFSLFVPAWASASSVESSLDLNLLPAEFVLGDSMRYLQDDEGQLSADQVVQLLTDRKRWIPSEDKVPNFGFSASTYWFQVSFENSSSVDIHKFIEISYPLLNEVQQYQVIDGVLNTGLHLGSAVPFSNRSIPHRNLIFPVVFPAHKSTTVLFSVHSGSAVQLPIKIWDERAFWQHDQADLAFQGLFFGLMGAMILYNLFIAWGIRVKIYFVYVGLLCSVTLFQMQIKGLAYQFIWPLFTDWNAYSLAVFIPLSNLAAGIFALEMLQVKLKLPLFYKPLKLCLTLCCLSVLMSLVLPYSISVQCSTVLVLIQSTIVTVICLLLSRIGEAEARVFTLAWLAFLLGSMVLALNKFSILPYNSFTENALQLGMSIEAMLLSLALTLRIKRLREDSVATKLEAQEIRLKAQIDSEEGRAKSEFLAMMSHEIRTPMNGVLGLVDVLRGTKLDDRQLQLIHVIQSSGEMLMNIINDILDFSKAEVDSLELESIPVDIETLVDDCTEIYAASPEQQGIFLFSYHDRNIPDTVQCDPTRLKQVLSNLLSNAFKFTQSGHVALTTQLIEDEHGQRIRFNVEDSGIGLTAVQQQRLFKPFSQADRSITRNFGGTGLGLAISKKIVESMGGKIGVNSQEGQGAHFWVDIPVELQASCYSEDSKHFLICTDYLPFIDFCKRATRDQNISLSFLPLDSTEKAPSFTHMLEDLSATDKALFDAALIFTATEAYNVNAMIEALQTVVATDKPVYCVKPGYRQDIATETLVQTVLSPLPLQLHKFLQLREKTKKIPTDDFVSAELPSAMKNLRVLVAEDNAVNQMVIQGLLSPMVAEVTLVNNGLEAVEKVQISPGYFDLIFMDCEMPEMDGYEATKTIRALENEHGWTAIKIVALTAHALAEFRKKALDSGMDEHLSKPVNRKQISLMLNQITVKREALVIN